MIVLYDGSFENFLNVVYEVYYKKLSPTEIVKEIPKTLFLDEVYTCPYKEREALKVLVALKKKFTKKNFETILNMFMCDGLSWEMELLYFIVAGFKNQQNLQNINNPAIFTLHSFEKQLFSNVHKMIAFLRFEELEDGSLYAKLESRFNLVYFTGKHFVERFNNQVYYIHDIKRSLVFVHTKEFIGVREIQEIELPKYSKDEQKFQKLWRRFFKSVSIESRKNEKLQKNLVPLLYRTYMHEFTV